MLITLEGIDGSGKTTVWRALKEDVDAVFTREPTDSWYGDAVQRSIETDDADPMAELFLYMADHADHLDRVIRPALDRGECVVSDRYVDSRVAYQSVTLADRLDDPAATIDAMHADWSRSPDLTIYLDVEPRVALERSAAANKFERLEHLEAVATTYEDRIATDPERFVRVDASEPPAAVSDRVREIVRTATE
ncbi:dTMP kinase [Halococcoides cellulosivorans]|uniref:Probable thymidylate kinase n=1 Tax=Halococcoides cellulosivorans TaxID=1679096 RepID=A0A2R4X1I2_9EURY|nr:dTMP kinase [Halococcoides cellulosivorans]AWB27593.1 dTMP kinase [Halococcoides cellulosivorans]